MTKPTVPARIDVLGPAASFGDPSPKAARVLMIGDIDRPEIGWALSSATCKPTRAPAHGGGNAPRACELDDSVCWQQVPDIRAAIESIDAGAPIPDVVVLAQPYPGCVAQHDVEVFRQRFPLVRVACLAGSWCDGESRSGRPLNGVFRIAWHQWPFHCSQHLAAFAKQQSGPWALPPTATQDDHLLARSARPQRRLSGAVGIASIEQARAQVADQSSENPPPTTSASSADWRGLRWIATDSPPAPTQELCRMLCEACVAYGGAGLFLRAELGRATRALASEHDGENSSSDRPALWSAPLQAVIAEVASLDSRARALVAHLAATIAPVPLALLASFPRIDQAAAAVAVGASAVLAKPFDLDDLFAWVERFGGEAPGDFGREQPPHPEQKHRS